MQSNAFFSFMLKASRSMGKIVCLLVCFSFFQQVMAQPSDPKANPVVAIDELTAVDGEWVGHLTYLDYTSKKEATINCNLSAKVIANKNAVRLSYIYPQEMDYNSADLVKITQQGTYLDDSKIIEKKHDGNGNFYLVTEKKGEDDNRPAMIQYIITLNADTFTITKMVKFEGEQSFFRRNIYSWSKA